MSLLKKGWSVRNRLNKYLQEHSHALRQIQEEKISLKKAQKALECHQKALRVVQEVAEMVQESAHAQISSIVIRCIQAIFPEHPYEFKIKFSQKRGKTEAELLFVKDGEELSDPMSQVGGGLVDVCSMALRIASLVLSQPPKTKLLVLDEPWKHVSSEYRPAIREMIEKLSEELEIQFIIVTHSEEFMFGNVIKL